MKKEKAYMMVYRRLRKDVRDGVYRLGEKIPSKRRSADRYGVSVITVEHAYDLLGEEGYIESRERSGYFVVYRANDFLGGVTEEMPLGRRRRIPKGEEPTTVFPFSIYAKTVRGVLAKYGESLLARPQNRGCLELQEAIAQYLRRVRGMVVKPEQVVIGSGAEYLYGLMIQMLGSNRLMALEDPGYEKIRNVYHSAGVKTEYLPMGSDGILSSALVQSKAHVLHVTPFHSFPSGITATAWKRQEYIAWAREREAVIIEDDYDSEFTILSKPEETLFSLAPPGTVIYLNTFTRTVAPAIRVGYMVLPDVWLSRFRQKAGFYSCTVPVLEQLVLAELLNDGSFERHINRVRRIKRKQAKEER